GQSRPYKRGGATIAESVTKERRSLSTQKDFDLYIARYASQNNNDSSKRNTFGSSLHKALKRDVYLDELDWDDNEV
ncbi:12547_t:CDS:1, partial [Acaulospora colombiana]